MQVHIDTFRNDPSETYLIGKGKRQRSVTIERNSVEITINGDRRRVRCSSVINNSNIRLYEIAVRFGAGKKVWPGGAMYWLETGNVNNVRPNIDRHSWHTFSVCGYAEDYKNKPVSSQHNAVR